MRSQDSRGFTLVLGGGGSVGIAYHCGVLRALEEVGGLDVRRAEVIIGTSAGAVVGTELRLGRDYDDILDHAGVHQAGRYDDHDFAPAWRSRTDLARRLIGSSWTAGHSMFPHAPALPAPPRAIEWIFPSSLFSMTTDEAAVARVPSEWPEEPLWTVAFDPDLRRRVVLRADAGDWQACELHLAVMASCTPPGFLPPVRLGRRRLVDGGVHSPTNLDLAARSGSPVVIAVAPLAYDPDDPPTRLLAITRRRFNTKLANEAREVQQVGADLVLLRPTGGEVRHHGLNLLRRHGNEVVYEAAYEATALRITSGALAPLAHLVAA
jgi:NTE family protein